VGIGRERISFSEGGTILNSKAVTLPVALNYVLGKRRHSLEAGVGITPMLRSGFEDAGTTGVVNLGYRFKPLRKGLVIRANITPHINANGIETGFAGFSIGAGF